MNKIDKIMELCYAASYDDNCPLCWDNTQTSEQVIRLVDLRDILQTVLGAKDGSTQNTIMDGRNSPLE